MSSALPWDQYSNQLQLDKLLNAQHLQSNAAGFPAHDEMLFIQFHQIYELWFKQILFELDDIQMRFSREKMLESDMQPILTYLNRIVLIFKQMEGMIDVLETMPPQSFVDFREYLGTASGFQSMQFRLIETRLGLERSKRLCVFHGAFDDNLKNESKEQIRSSEERPSLFRQLEAWLGRTPFVQLGQYKFWQEYRDAVHRMFDDRTQAIMATLHGESLAKELEAIERGRDKFDGIFDENKHTVAIENGQWRLSLPALQAALFITIYRSEPILQAPYQLLTALVDVDELLARWRFRHALMVQRMIGMSSGTGGSSGYEYLMNTVRSHRIFTDLFALSSYLIPTKSIPALPPEVSHKMNYIYTTG